MSRDKEKYKRHWFGKEVADIRSSIPDISLRSSFDICVEVSTGWLDI